VEADQTLAIAVKIIPPHLRVDKLSTEQTDGKGSGPRKKEYSFGAYEPEQETRGEDGGRGKTAASSRRPPGFPRDRRA
jgi:hypothetical protein